MLFVGHFIFQFYFSTTHMIVIFKFYATQKKFVSINILCNFFVQSVYTIGPLSFSQEGLIVMQG